MEDMEISRIFTDDDADDDDDDGDGDERTEMIKTKDEFGQYDDDETMNTSSECSGEDLPAPLWSG